MDRQRGRAAKMRLWREEGAEEEVRALEVGGCCVLCLPLRVLVPACCACGIAAGGCRYAAWRRACKRAPRPHACMLATQMGTQTERETHTYTHTSACMHVCVQRPGVRITPFAFPL